MKSIYDLVKQADERKTSISRIIIDQQISELSISESEAVEEMALRYRIMRESVIRGIKLNSKSVTGLSGGDAFLLDSYIKNEFSHGNGITVRIMRNAVAVSEVNASMGKIVAAPTAGSCGIIPGLLTVLEDEKRIEREKVVMSLFTAAGFGSVVAQRSTLSGAEGGCQAECGAAAAMAASAGCELLGGTPEQCSHAFSLSLINSLGLVCDPVGGYVEYPCVYRNAIGAVNAYSAMIMALSGIKSIISADDVIAAMKDVGEKMDTTLKETSLGGLAATPSACSICSSFLK